MSRLLLVLAFLLAWTLPAPAQLDPRLSEPYQLRIVLRVARHRLLTPIFKDQLQRELHDSLQAALGPMGQVEVLDMTRRDVLERHPLYQEVEARGLEAALDAYHEVSDVKTHFVLVDFVDGVYEIQARQHDGPTGLASPVVRKTRTTDRQLVGRLAALFIDQDFGFVGTLIPGSGATVQVEFMAGRLGGPAGQWVKKGDVFAVAAISQRGSGRQSQQIPWVLVQAQDEPVEGRCHGQLWSRWQTPLPTPGDVVGFRCLKLSTIRAPLRLRLLRNDRAGTPAAGVQVWIDAQGFTEKPRETRVTAADGLVQSTERYPGVAFVQVVQGLAIQAKIPVALVDDRVVVATVDLSAGGELRGQLELRRNRWLQRVYEAHQVVTLLFKELNALNAQKDTRERAQARTERGIADLTADLANLEREQANLRDAVRKLPAGTSLDLGDGERRLEELKQRRQELQDYLVGLRKAQEIENDPKRREWESRRSQAQLLETELEFGKALELYEQILAEAGDMVPGLRKYVADLKQQWDTKGNRAHEDARQFTYVTWLQLADAAQIQAHLDQAQKALATFKQVGDRLSPLKLHQGIVAHAGKLVREREKYAQADSEDAKKALTTVKDAAEGLAVLEKQIAQYVGTGKSGSK